jgi:hypothetical protein
MNSWDLRMFQNDLSIFLNLIDTKYPITGDFSKLWDLYGRLYTDFKYVLEPVVFHISGSISGSIPSNLNRHKIYFENSLSINDAKSEYEDLIQDYKFELNMDSYLHTDYGEPKLYKSAWHHDKHNDSDEPKYTHPTYHFHFGGRFLKGLESGDLSIMSCPRIPHPPMDVFLGFHFIISNFFSTKDFPIINELKNSYEYQEIIKRAQERLWTPYFKAFDSTNTHQDFTIDNLFPLYIN